MLSNDHVYGSISIFTLAVITACIQLIIYEIYLKNIPREIIGINRKIYIQSLSDEEINRRLSENPFYKQLKVAHSENKQHLNLLLIVSSAPARFDRRRHIRKTWWTDCRSSFQKTVRCMFMTDKVPPDHKYYSLIKEEREKYQDLELQNLGGGMKFGHRMIYHMLYAYMNYNFDYFLRLDDDYFICAEKLIYELPMPSLKRFHWGWVHLSGPEEERRPEESVFLVSKDVIETFLLQNTSSMICHPLADQMIILWSNMVDLKHIFRHDSRLHHYIDKQNADRVATDSEICKHFIGVHGAYPDKMLNLWERRGPETKLDGDLYSNSFSVSITEDFCWSCIGHPWQYEPKLCIENYKWDTSVHGKDVYVGASGKI